jgi:hypothetical protein
MALVRFNAVDKKISEGQVLWQVALTRPQRKRFGPRSKALFAFTSE